MSDRLTTWKARIFDFALFILSADEEYFRLDATSCVASLDNISTATNTGSGLFVR